MKKGEKLFINFDNGSGGNLILESEVHQFSEDKKWVHLKFATGGETWRAVKEIKEKLPKHYNGRIV